MREKFLKLREKLSMLREKISKSREISSWFLPYDCIDILNTLKVSRSNTTLIFSSPDMITPLV